MGCLYIKDLDKLDIDILEQIISESFARLSNGTHTERAREGTS